MKLKVSLKILSFLIVTTALGEFEQEGFVSKYPRLSL